MPNSEPAKLSPLEVKRALNRNIVAGSFGMLFATCLSLQFVTQFALQMGATEFQIGLLTSLPLLTYPFQLLGAYLVERIHRRKRFWFTLSLVYRLLWLPMTAIPFFIGHEFESWQVHIFLALFLVANALASMSVPPWFSWMADIVPPEKAGRFWNRRAAVLNAVMLSSLVFGRFVDMFEHGSFVPFAILFGLGVLVGELDLLIHYKIPEPPMSEPPQRLNLFGMLREPVRNPQFRRFLLWNCSYSFAVTVISAYYMVFLLQHLHLSQFFISLLISISMVSRILISRYWGYIADRFGHAAVNTICDFCLIVYLFGFLFVTPSNYVWLLILLHAAGGIFGIGIETASTSLMLGLAPTQNKSIFIAVLSSLVGVVAALAPPVGGWVLGHFEGRTSHFMLWEFDRFQMLFLIGILLRLLFFPFSLRLNDVAGGSTALVVRRLMDTNPFRVIRHVHVLTDSSAEAERVRSVVELGSARSAIATRELVAALEDPSREVRLEAAFALARIGDPEAVEPLVHCLRSPDSGIQAAAAYALGKLRDARAVPPLVEALNDAYLAHVAAISLGEIGDRAAVGPLLELLRNEHTTEPVRAGAAYALSRLNETSALPDILSALRRTQSALVRQELALAIGNLLGPLGEFYRLLTRERQVPGQEISRRHDQIVRARARFKSNPDLIQQAIHQLDLAQSSYNKERWQDAMQAYTRAGLFLSGSLPLAQAEEGLFDFLTDRSRQHRRKMDAQLKRSDQPNPPLWFLLSVAYPHAVAVSATREEALLSFYALWRIWEDKIG